MGKVKVKILGNEHEIGTSCEDRVSQITTIYPSAKASVHKTEYEIDNVEPIDLTYEACIYHAGRCQTFHKETYKLFKLVFPDLDINNPIDPEKVKQQGSGFKHVLGRVDLALKLQDLGVSHIHRYPEAGLHPRAQCNLADLFIQLRERSFTPEEREIITARTVADTLETSARKNK